MSNYLSKLLQRLVKRNVAEADYLQAVSYLNTERAEMAFARINAQGDIAHFYEHKGNGSLGSLLSSVDLASYGEHAICNIVPLSRYQSITVEKPSVPDGDVIEALRWQLMDSVNMDVEAARIGYFDLPASERDPTPMVSASLLPNAEYEEQVALHEQLGVKLETMTVPEMALAGLLSILPKKVAYGAIVIGIDRVMVVAYADGELLFSRQAPFRFTSQQDMLEGVGRLARECGHVVNYLRGQFNHYELASFFCFFDDKDAVIVDALMGSDQLSIELKHYPWDQVSGLDVTPQTVGGQLVCGMAIALPELAR